MSNNDKILELIYESTKAPNYDYLLKEDVCNFNWERFWEVFYICKQTSYSLYESFEKINFNDHTDLYHVISTNGMEFKLSVSFYDKRHLHTEFLNTLYINFEDRDFLKSLQQVLGNTKTPIVNINFQDNEGEIKTTNKLGNYAYSVIQSIKDAIITSMHERTQTFPDILYFYILKTEKRKLDFFVKIIETMFPDFKHYYVDSKSNKQFNLVYFYV